MPEQTLAQRVKAKFPGEYDDIPDVELEKKVKAKYPGEYDDLPTTPEGKSHGAIIDTAWNFGKRIKDVAVGMADMIPAVQGGNFQKEWEESKKSPEARAAFLAKTKGITEAPFKEPVKSTGQALLNIADPMGLAAGTYGLGRQALTEDIPQGNWGGFAANAGLLSLPLLGLLSPKAKVPAPKEPLALPPGTSPKLLPAIGETSPANPRFYAGRAGTFDANVTYPSDINLPLTPKLGATLLPHEFGEIVDVGPQIAASRSTWGLPDNLMKDPTFDALIPDRYKVPKLVPQTDQIIGSPKPVPKVTQQWPEGGIIPKREVPSVAIDVAPFIPPEYGTSLSAREFLKIAEKERQLGDVSTPVDVKKIGKSTPLKDVLPPGIKVRSDEGFIDVASFADELAKGKKTLFDAFKPEGKGRKTFTEIFKKNPEAPLTGDYDLSKLDKEIEVATAKIKSLKNLEKSAIKRLDYEKAESYRHASLDLEDLLSNLNKIKTAPKFELGIVTKEGEVVTVPTESLWKDIHGDKPELEVASRHGTVYSNPDRIRIDHAEKKIIWSNDPSPRAYFQVEAKYPGYTHEGQWGTKINPPPPTEDLYAGVKPSLPPALTAKVKEFVDAFKPEPREGVSQPRPVKIPTQANVGGEPVNKVIQAMREARRFRVIQDEIIKQTRIERMKAAEAAGGTGMSKFYNELAELSGEMEGVKVQNLGKYLDEGTQGALMDTITNSQLPFFERLRAKKGLSRLLNGERVPPPNELALLEKIFGKEFVGEIHNLYAGIPIEKVPTGRELVATGIKVSNTAKSISSSYDVSAPFRQGLGLVHKAGFWRGFEPMFKSLASDKYYNEFQKSIHQDPFYPLAKKHKLALTDLNELSTREEAFHSSWAEKKIPGVKPSNRAFITFLNKARFDTFKALVEKNSKAGKLTPEMIQEFADYVNNATGRGDLGALEQHAVVLNGLLFSPRLIASRARMLNNVFNPASFMKLSKQARMEYWKSAAAVATTSIIMTNLLDLFGGKTSHDPRSSDFQKSKLDKVRLDPNGGFQQFIVALTRLAANQTVGSYGYEKNLGEGYKADTRWDILERFGISKASPIASFIASWLKGTDFVGNKLDETGLAGEAVNKFIPLVLQDLYDIATKDPEFLPLMPLAALGMGLQDYRESTSGGVGRDIAEFINSTVGSIPMPKNDPFTGMPNLFRAKPSAAELPKVEAPVSKIPTLDEKIATIASKFDIDPDLFKSLITQESKGKSDAVSSKGAVGIAQLMPALAKAYGVTDRTNIDQSLEGGAKFLSDLMKKYGDERIALAAYNAGEKRVDAWLKTKPNMRTLEGLPSETRKYVPSILNRVNR